MVKIWIGDDLLDMSDSENLSLEYSSPFFEIEVQRGEYSFPFKVPLTERNRKLLNNPHLLHNPEATLTYAVTFERLRKVNTGILYVDSVDFDFNANAGYCNCTLAGTEGVFLEAVGNKKLSELTLAPAFAIPEYDIALPGTIHSDACYYASDIANGVVTDMPFVFPMIRWDEFGEFEGGELSAVPADLCTGFVNFYTKQPFQSTIVGPQYEQVMQKEGILAWQYNRLVPCFYKKWVLQKVFEEFGYTLTGTLLDDVAFSAEIIISNRAINKWVSSLLGVSFRGETLQFIDYATQIVAAQHMPDITVTDFVNDICREYNVQILPVSGTEWRIYSKNEVLQSTEIIEVKPEEVNPFFRKLIKESDDVRQGTNLSYPNTDAFFEIKVIELDETLLRGEVEDESDLAGIPSPQEGDIWLIRNQGNLVQYVDGSFTWLMQNIANYEPYEKGTGIEIMSTPLAMDFINGFYQNNAGVENHYDGLFPRIEFGGNWILENGMATENVPMPYRSMLYFGLNNNTTDVDYDTPFSSYSNYDYALNKVFDWCLSLYGTEGIYDTFYKLWDATKANSTKYEITAYLSETKLEALQFSIKVLIKQQQFLVYSKKFNAPYRNVSALQVYKI